MHVMDEMVVEAMYEITDLPVKFSIAYAKSVEKIATEEPPQNPTFDQIIARYLISLDHMDELRACGWDAVEVVKEFLEDNAYDGLAGDGCGCKLEDLILCGERDLCGDCKAGYVKKCEPDREDEDSPCSDCDAFGVPESQWCLTTVKPVEEK